MSEELTGLAMFEDDQDTLAAEYVLGTLSAQERDQAEALLSFDPQFEAAVRQWERRLGELNVMVEAVEPPPRVWEKIKIEIGPVETPSATDLPQAAAPEQEVSPAAATLAADLLPPEAEPAKATPAETPLGPAAASPSPEPSPAPAPKKVERSADVVSLESKVKRWRGITLGIGALAALLAIYIAVEQFKPDLIPAQMRPAGPGSGRANPGTGTLAPGSAGCGAATGADRTGVPPHPRHAKVDADRTAGVGYTRGRAKLRAVVDLKAVPKPAFARNRGQ